MYKTEPKKRFEMVRKHQTPEREAMMQRMMENAFPTHSDIVRNDKFVEQLDVNIQNIIRDRWDRKPAPDGYRYKRDWVDQMKESGDLRAAYFLDHIESIWQRTSNVSSVRREAILMVCNYTLLQVLEKMCDDLEERS